MIAAHWRDLNPGTRVRIHGELADRNGDPIPTPCLGTVVASYTNDDLTVYVEADGHPGSRFKFEDSDGWLAYGEGGRFVGLELLAPASSAVA